MMDFSCQIELTQGQIARVSPEDFEELTRYKWHACLRGNHFYAARKGTRVNGKSATILMHRQIMGNPPGMMVDHVSGDTLDNRRDNLRTATHAENMRNSKRHSTNKCGFKGVSWHEISNGWRAGLRVNKAYIYLGIFGTPEDAYAAYCVAAKKHHGDFARVA